MFITQYEYVPPPPIITLDNTAEVIPVIQNDHTVYESDIVETESDIDDPEPNSDEDNIPIKYRLPQTKLELYNKIRTLSIYVIVEFKGQQFPSFVTAKVSKKFVACQS